MQGHLKSPRFYAPIPEKLKEFVITKNCEKKKNYIHQENKYHR